VERLVQESFSGKWPWVLVVEDDAGEAELLRRTMESCGCHCEVRRTVSSAIEELDRRPPDLILLDIKLEGENGSEVVSAVKARHKETPIICITHYPDAYRLSQILKQGCVGIVEKPITPIVVDDILKMYHLKEP
jgi:DNA-binding NtrC family response regulator